MLIEQTKDKCSIRAEIISSCSPATGEWDSECRIYLGQRLIGTLDDGIMGDEICIRGIFDYENVKGLDVVDNALYLDANELQTIIEIIDHWIDDEEYKEKWEKVG